MATSHPTHHSLSARGIREDEHPFWTQAFRPDDRFQQLDEDHFAWLSVTGVLLTIVTLGVLFAALSVAICVAG